MKNVHFGFGVSFCPGTKPSVGLNARGNVIVVHEAPRGEKRYRVGRLDQDIVGLLPLGPVGTDDAGDLGAVPVPAHDQAADRLLREVAARRYGGRVEQPDQLSERLTLAVVRGGRGEDERLGLPRQQPSELVVLRGRVGDVGLNVSDCDRGTRQGGPVRVCDVAGDGAARLLRPSRDERDEEEEHGGEAPTKSVHAHYFLPFPVGFLRSLF